MNLPKFLKSKRNILRFVIVAALSFAVLALILRPSNKIYAGWMDDHWLYRTPYTITNGGSADTDKKVKFDIDTETLINNSKMESQCQDSRFTDANGKVLDYYLENGSGGGTPSSISYISDSDTSTSVASGGTLSFNHDSGSDGSNRALVVIVHALNTFGSGQQDIEMDTVTYNGILLSRGASKSFYDSNRNYSSEIWVLTDPPTGSNSLVVTYTTSNMEEIVIEAMNFTGVDPYEPVGAQGFNTHTSSSSLTVSLTTESDDSVIIAGGLRRNDESDPLSLSTGTTTYQIETAVTSQGIGTAGGYQAAATAGSHDVTVSGPSQNRDMMMIAMELKADRGYLSNIALEGKTVHRNASGSSPETFSHTVASATDQVLVVIVHGLRAAAGAESTDINVSALTYNGDSLTRQSNVDSSATDRRALTEVWTLVNPDTGSNTVSVTYSGATPTKQVITAFNFSGVDQTTPVGATGTNSTTGTYLLSQSISTSYTQSLIVGGGMRHYNSTPDLSMLYLTNGYGIVQWQSNSESNNALDNADGFIQTVATGSYTFGVDTTNSQSALSINLAAIELKPSAVVESGDTCDDASTDYYVLLPNIPAGAFTIYHYYGNPNATAGTQSEQFSQSEFTPSAGPTGGSEAKSPGPVAYYKFDEGYGTTANNTAGSSGAGTLNNSPTWTEESQCISGKCLYFDGSNDNVSVPDDDDIDASVNSRTYEAWVRVTGDITGGSGGIREIIGKYPTAGNEPRVDINISKTTGFIQFAIESSVNGNFTQVVGTSDLRDSRWHHIAAVRDRDADLMLLYVDGLLEDSETDGDYDGANNGTLYIGDYGLSLASGRTFQGYIDEVKIYPYARSEIEIKTDFVARGSMNGVSARLGGQSDGNILSDGLVGYWAMDESSWTNDCSTATVLDSSGNGNTGISCPSSTGPTGGAQGKFGNGGLFDGSNDQIVVTDSGSLDVGTKATWSVWFKLNDLPSSVGNTFRILDKWDGTGNQRSFALYIATTDKLHMDVDPLGEASLDVDIAGNDALSTGVWYHVVVIVDGSSGYMYVNGVLQDDVETVSGVYSSTTNLYIGSDASSLYFEGILDEVRMYNRDLSHREVLMLYNWGAGPIAYYPFNENTGTTSINDVSGNQFTGTMGGSMTESDWVTGKYGSALDFDGTNDFVDIYSSGLNSVFSGNAGTISLWGKLPSAAWTNAESDTFITFRGADANNEIKLYKNTASNTLTMDYLAGGTGESASITTSTTDWFHLSISWDKTADSVKYYFNGVLQETDTSLGTWSGPLDADRTVIGSHRSDTTGNNLIGAIDDVRIYNYARTSGQIIEDLNGGHPLGGSPVGSPVSYWKFDSGNGISAYDGISSNTLTLSSASWTNSGKFDKAWNGTGSVWLSRSDDPDFDFTGSDDFTFSMWIKSDSASNPGASQYLVHKLTSGIGYRLSFNTSGQLVLETDDDGTCCDDTVTTSIDYYDGTWHHLVVVRNLAQDNHYIYVDGNLVQTDSDITATGSLANAASLYIGDDDGDSTNSFAGDIDELKIYRAALSREQIKIDYNRGKSSVLGAISTASDGTTPDNSFLRKYCVLGSTASCNPPVAEYLFDENTGTSSVVDTSGNNLGGTMNGSMTESDWVPGKYGSALSLDGSNDDIQVTYNSVLDASTFTVQAWVKLTAKTNWANIISKDSDGSGVTFNYRLQLDNSGSQKFLFGYAYGFGSNDTITSVLVPDVDTWYHVTGVYTGSLLQIYINGILDTSISSSNTPLTGAQPLFIGDSIDSSQLNGVVDDVRIYNYVRTPAQIALDYNGGAPVVSYKLDECSGTTINNSAPAASGGDSGDDMTLVINSSGDYTSVGYCSSGTGTHAWNAGTTGKYSSAMAFDGTDDFAYMTSIGDNLKPTKNITVSAWIKGDTFTSSGNTRAYFVAEQPENAWGDGRGYNLQGVNGNATFQIGDGSSTWKSATGSTTMSTGVWYHVVGTYDGATLKVYVNGVLDGSTSTSVSIYYVDGVGGPNEQTLYIGAQHDADNTSPTTTADLYLFDGLVDDVQIYHYDMTAEQVKTLYNRGAVHFQ